MGLVTKQFSFRAPALPAVSWGILAEARVDLIWSLRLSQAMRLPGSEILSSLDQQLSFDENQGRFLSVLYYFKTHASLLSVFLGGFPCT